MIPFGKHKGDPLSTVPSGYLRWLLSTVRLSSGLEAAVREELASRGVKIPGPPPRARHACREHPGAGIKATWISMRDGRKAIRGECAKCGAWLGALPLTNEYKALADQGSDKAALLSFLMRIDEQGIEVRKVHGDLQFSRPLPPDLWALERQCRGVLISMLVAENPTREG